MVDKENHQKDSEASEKDFIQTIFNRGRASSEKLQDLMINISNAALGVFFFSLTTEIKPPLREIESFSLFLAVVFFALASSIGLLSWYSDGKWNFFWASAMKETNKASKKELYTKRDKWKNIDHKGGRIHLICFVAGFAMAIAYLILRISN